MDGVLADFNALADKIRRSGDNLNRSTELLDEAQKLAKLEFYRTIEGTDFFSDLPVMPGAKEMLDAARTAVNGNIFILSKAPKAKNFVTGVEWQKQIAVQKTEWALKHFGNYFAQDKIIVVTDSTKDELIRPVQSDILIDDRPENIDDWNTAGGTGILYTSADNVILALAKL
jgi:5'(3')-deoxyribonucleotidase